MYPNGAYDQNMPEQPEASGLQTSQTHVPAAEVAPLGRTERPLRGRKREGAAGGGGGTGRASAYPEPVDRLIGEFAKLPGIGRRSAERLAFHILKSGEPEAMLLAQAVADVKRAVHHCSICFNLTDADPCRVCGDSGRERHAVLVVEQPKDLIALEQTGMYRGLYHVLMGHISPLDGIGPGDLTIADLLARIDDSSRNPGGVPIREVIMGLNPTVEGDGTALYLAEELKHRHTPDGQPVRVSRLARGLPTGGSLEFANKAVLADAIQCRQSME
jgi:recombination protein RecR